MSAGVQMRWVYEFAHRARTVELGPHADEQEARENFHRIYGYWPGDVLTTTPWTPRSAS